MHFALSNCKMLLQDWIDSKSIHILVGEEFDEVYGYWYSSSYVSPSGRISDEVSSHIQRA